MENENALKWLVPICTILFVVICLIDIHLKNSLLREADRLMRVIENGRREAESVGKPANKPDRANRVGSRDMVDGANTVSASNGSSPVESVESMEDYADEVG